MQGTVSTRAQLDEFVKNHVCCKCHNERVNDMFIESNCHPDSPPVAWYDSESGILNIECSHCSQPIITVEVK